MRSPEGEGLVVGELTRDFTSQTQPFFEAPRVRLFVRKRHASFHVPLSTMAQIEHAALWTSDLEQAREFYETYFGAEAGTRYRNEKKDFTSYFLSFDSGARLELMHTSDLEEASASEGTELEGYDHLALSVGSEAEVDRRTRTLRRDGYEVVGEPRRTGDGYYESVVLDPDGNRVEITV